MFFNAFADHTAIELANTAQDTITDSTITNQHATGNGVTIGTVHNGTVQRNAISAVGGNAVYLNGSGSVIGADISYNTLTSSTGNGIFSDGTAQFSYSTNNFEVTDGTHVCSGCAGKVLWSNGNILNDTALLASQTTIPAYVFVTSTFTTSGSGTALEAITGLTWTMPGTSALNVPFHCALVYHQNSANAAVAFGFQNANTGATNLLAFGRINTSATAFAEANVANTTGTTATAVVSGTPSAITTNWNAYLDGMIEQPSGTASTFTIRVSTATQGDTVSVLRGSYCRIG